MKEPHPASRKLQKELNSGTAALVLLSVLGRSRRPMYGYEISRRIEQAGQEVAIMKQGALYPVLRSLEKSGLLSSEVEPSVSGPPRRYYRITSEGRVTLRQWKQIWHGFRNFVDEMVRGGADD